MVELICSLNLLGCIVLSFLLAGVAEGAVGTYIAWQVGQSRRGVKCDCEEPVFETGLLKKAECCPCKRAAPGTKPTSLQAVAFSRIWLLDFYFCIYLFLP